MKINKEGYDKNHQIQFFDNTTGELGSYPELTSGGFFRLVTYGTFLDIVEDYEKAQGLSELKFSPFEVVTVLPARLREE